MKAIFLRLDDPTDRPTALAGLVAATNAGSTVAAALVDPAEFRAIAGATFAYWAPAPLRNCFVRVPAFRTERRTGMVGASTKNDFRYVRLSWEHAQRSFDPWPPFGKGGAYALMYGDFPLTVNWAIQGRELKADISEYRGSRGWGYQWSAALNGHDYYRRPGLTWSLRTQKGLAFRCLPAGGLFSHKGPTVFVDGDAASELLASLAILNSVPYVRLVDLQMTFGSYEAGVIQRTPFPRIPPETASNLTTLVRNAWSLKRSLDTITETSHAFHLPALLCASVPLCETLSDRATAWTAHIESIEVQLATIQAEIDDIAFRLYGIDGEDRARIEAEAGPPSGLRPPSPVGREKDPSQEEAPEQDDEGTGADEEEEDEGASADTATLATELLSWAIGVAFGRFDLRHATGELPPPVEPGPFDPLPARSPGMCPDDALAVELLVDDPGHPLDLSARVAEVFARIFGAAGEARLDEALRLAGAPDLPTFLRRSFFPFHLKRYSKSRRKAPIWWPLSTASGGYTVWLSWPRLSRDTLFRVADELKRQKLPFELRRLTSLKQDAGPNPSTREKTVIAAQEGFVSELSALLEEVERVAPMWSPVHDDGVILHFALLWRIVRDAAWQKECRAAWDKLAKGDYDWAHISMHLWPERVAPKCRTDRSLAIAHGLEETFWVEVDGKWRARDHTDEALAAAIAARSSPAVKAALRGFEQAPVPSRGGRGRKGG